MEKAKIVLVGVGGYGVNYVAFFKDRLEHGIEDFSIEGVVDPFAEKSYYWNWIAEKEYPVYDSLEAFYAEKNADLAMIATPIPLHESQCVYAMEHGSHVLVEKPLCPTVQQARHLDAVSRKTGKFLAVGFQWSFSDPILKLKQDIMDGKLGEPVSMKGFVSWKRYQGYYHNTWKGKYRDKNGNLILDCVITNATAHYLHNLFFVAGAKFGLDAAAMPERVMAEAYRIKPDMETPDLFALRGELPGQVPFWFASSYSLTGEQTTRFEYTFTCAQVRFNEDDNDNLVRVKFKDGTEKVYGNPQCTEEIQRKMDKALQAVLTGDTSQLTCGVSTIMPHLAVTNAMLEKIPRQNADEHYLVEEREKPGDEQSDRGIFAHSLRDDLLLCYAQMKLPSECGYRWEKPAVAFDPREVHEAFANQY